MRKTKIAKKWNHTKGMAIEHQMEKALREATLPLVKDLVTALVDQGLTYEKACKTIRWATHVLDSTERYKPNA
jgi:hypothetical protein